MFLTQMETLFPGYPTYIDWAVIVSVMENYVRTSVLKVLLYRGKVQWAQLVFPQFLCFNLKIYMTLCSRRPESLSVPPSALKISQIKRNFTTNKFHCFIVHFLSLSFIHTNSCTFSYNHVLVF